MNVIVVVIDTLRYDHVAANGNESISTPDLDRLISSWNGLSRILDVRPGRANPAAG